MLKEQSDERRGFEKKRKRKRETASPRGGERRKLCDRPDQANILEDTVGGWGVGRGVKPRFVQEQGRGAFGK